MKHEELGHVNCSLARTWSVIGERWTLLIIREAFRGTRRFDSFQQRLGVGRNVLSNRLGRLTADGIFERVRYQRAPDRYEYRLSEKGMDLYPALRMLRRWGDRYKVDEPPVRLYHKGCGELALPELRCRHCGDPVDFYSLRAEYAPDAW
jgi:DNA-binding HxlR family transcriptional regulator